MSKSLKILTLTTFIPITYSILHDQFTARRCVENFTVFHRRAIAGDSALLQVLCLTASDRLHLGKMGGIISLMLWLFRVSGEAASCI